jgi:hypothetical protein
MNNGDYMKFAWILLGALNLSALFFIVKYIVTRRKKDDEYFYVHSVVIANMMSLVLYYNFIASSFNMKQYAIFVVAAIAGVYSIMDIAKKILPKSSTESSVLSNESKKMTLFVTTKDRSLSIIVYIISIAACSMFYWVSEK